MPSDSTGQGNKKLCVEAHFQMPKDKNLGRRHQETLVLKSRRRTFHKKGKVKKGGKGKKLE